MSNNDAASQRAPLPPALLAAKADPTEAKRWRVLLADDHEMLLDMLRSLLEPEFEVVGAVTSGLALLEMAQHLRPDVALIDVVMPGLGGLEAGRQLLAKVPATKIVYLTMEADETVAAQAFAAGASAYLLKASPATELQQTIRLVANGGRYLTMAIAQGDVEVLCEAYKANPIARLSQRELEVLKLLVSGLSMKAVARRLGITPRTVAFHKYRAMDVLGLQGNSALIEFAIRHGMLGRDAVAPRLRTRHDWSRRDDQVTD